MSEQAGWTQFVDEEWNSDKAIKHRVADPGGVQAIRESWGLRNLNDADGLPEALQAWLGTGVTPYQFFLEMRLAKLQQDSKEPA